MLRRVTGLKICSGSSKISQESWTSPRRENPSFQAGWLVFLLSISPSLSLSLPPSLFSPAPSQFAHLSSYFPAPLKPQVTVPSWQSELRCSQRGPNKRSRDSKCKPCRGPLFGFVLWAPSTFLTVTTWVGAFLSRGARYQPWLDLNN